MSISALFSSNVSSSRDYNAVQLQLDQDLDLIFACSNLYRQDDDCRCLKTIDLWRVNNHPLSNTNCHCLETENSPFLPLIEDEDLGSFPLNLLRRISHVPTDSLKYYDEEITKIQKYAQKIYKLGKHEKYTIMRMPSVHHLFSQTTLNSLTSKFKIDTLLINDYSYTKTLPLHILANVKVIKITSFSYKEFTIPSFGYLPKLEKLINTDSSITNLDKIDEIIQNKIYHNQKKFKNYHLFFYKPDYIRGSRVWEWDLFDGFLNRFYEDTLHLNRFPYKHFIRKIFNFFDNNKQQCREILNFGQTSRFFRLQTLENIQNPAIVRSLNLSNLEIRQLPISLNKLENLRELNLSGLPLTTFPEEIFELKNLEKLDLTTVTPILIPDKIKQLIHLKFLRLNGTSETDIPEAVKTLIAEKLAAAPNLLEQITTIEKNTITISWIFSYTNFFRPTFPVDLYSVIKKYLSFIDRCKLSRASTSFNTLMIEKDKQDFAKNWTIISFAVNFPSLKPLVSSYLDGHEKIYKDETTAWVQKTELSILNVQKNAKAILVELGKDDFPFQEETEVDFSMNLVELAWFCDKTLFSSKKQVEFFHQRHPKNWFSLHSNPVRTLPLKITNCLIKMPLKELALESLINLEEVPELLRQLPNIKVTLPKKLQPLKPSSYLAKREISVIETDSPSLLSRMLAVAKAVMLFVAKVLLVIALFAAFAAMVAGGLYLAGYPLSLETLSNKVGLG